MIKIKIGDIGIILITVILIFFSFRLIGQYGGEPEVYVTSEGKEWIFPLNQPNTVSFEGPIGKTTMIIDDGFVHVHDSDCNNKICITMGAISRPGQWIICLPNNVFIRIEGRKIISEEEPDDISF